VRGHGAWRIWLLVAGLALGLLAVMGRLGQLQLRDHEQYARRARLLRTADALLPGLRGAILDANGAPLAMSVDSYNVMVEKRAWQDRGRALAAARQLAALTGGSPEAMVERVLASPAFETEVARGLDYEQALAVRRLGLEGVRLVQDGRRIYPEGSLAAQLIGVVGRDGVGLSGLEADLDALLRGQPGHSSWERDGNGQGMYWSGWQEVPPRSGAAVVLTIDRYLQRVVEQALEEAIRQHKARGGSVVVMDARTGALLALASRPTFDLTRPDFQDPQQVALLRNPAVTDPYEPGSVFKVITTAAAIDSGVAGPSTYWYDAGVAVIGEARIYNWDFSANGTQTVTQMLTKSLNTGAVWLAQRLGAQRFYDYVRRFGFGEPTGIGLGGEAAGQVRWPGDPRWSELDLATNSFGQGISVTPIQMAAALAAIANEGRLMRPYVVRAIVTPEGVRETQPQMVRQVISPEAARTVLQMMGAVADRIPTNLLSVPGYKVAGKTGTANLVAGGSYKPNAYISSFAGIVPLDDPRLVVLVKIDEPQDVPWGTVVAAPVFAQVAREAMVYYRVPPAGLVAAQPGR
jgi:cell division protein FtsI/penicillin-binding protein 2